MSKLQQELTALNRDYSIQMQTLNLEFQMDARFYTSRIIEYNFSHPLYRWVMRMTCRVKGHIPGSTCYRCCCVLDIDTQRDRTQMRLIAASAKRLEPINQNKIIIL